MTQRSTLLAFVSGLIGVIIHSIIVIFLLSYLAYPEMLAVMIDTTTGTEQQMLMVFAEEASQIQPIIYAGTAIIIFEWIAIFKIRKVENTMTPVWAAFLLLGSMFAYFYFGGIEVFILLFAAGSLTMYKYFKHGKS